jgi:hypothetical protein
MNQFVLLSIFLVVLTYYGGKYVPKMLKDNKQVLLGFAVALLLCSFFKKDLVEGHAQNWPEKDHFYLVKGICAPNINVDRQTGVETPRNLRLGITYYHTPDCTGDGWLNGERIIH